MLTDRKNIKKYKIFDKKITAPIKIYASVDANSVLMNSFYFRWLFLYLNLSFIVPKHKQPVTLTTIAKVTG